MNNNVIKDSNGASNSVHTIDFSTQGFTTVICKDTIRYEQLAESSIESASDVPVNLSIHASINTTDSQVSNQRSANAFCHISNTNNIRGKCYLCSKYSTLFNSTTTNIKIMLLYYLLYGIFTSIWTQQVLTTYIYKLSNDKTTVLGYIETAQGIAYILTMPLAGYLTDKHSRLFIIRIVSILGILIIPFAISVLLYFESVTYFYILLPMYAIFVCLQITVLDSLFADITKQGSRDFIYSIKYFLNQFGYAFGPFIVFLMFLYLGDDWSKFEMNVSLITGLTLWIIPNLILIFCFNDKYIPGISQKPKKHKDISTNKDTSKHIVLPELSNNNTNNNNNNTTTNESRVKYTRFVPWIMVTHKIIMSAGAGMTVKYFVIFFEDILLLGSIEIALLYFIVQISLAVGSLLLKKLANCVGRPWTIISAKCIGIACLIIMAKYSKNNKNYSSMEVYFLCACYILRTAMMNATSPFEKAILMDYSSKENRGKWNSVESLRRSGWTFSAGVGGYIIQLWGFQSIYLITSGIYAFATILLLPIICIVEK